MHYRKSGSLQVQSVIDDADLADRIETAIESNPEMTESRLIREALREYLD